MSDHIPFFSDLPVKAVSAAQRLFDEVQQPGYSLPAAYSNFVSRLNASGATPPARAVVKRWAAGVQCGQVARPTMPGGGDDADVPPAPAANYFEELPDAALPALATAREAIVAATGAADEEDQDERIFDAFFDAMREIGHLEPHWRAFVAYAKGTRLGQVGQRAKIVAPVLDAASGRAVQPATVTEIDPDAALDFVPLTPADFRSTVLVKAALDPIPPIPQGSTVTLIDDALAKDGVASALRSFRDELIDLTYSSLQADLRRRAEGIVASQLRAMADEMEGGKETKVDAFLAACRTVAAVMAEDGLPHDATICAAMMPGAGEVGPSALAAGNAIFRDAQKDLQLGKGL